MAPSWTCVCCSAMNAADGATATAIVHHCWSCGRFQPRVCELPQHYFNVASCGEFPSRATKRLLADYYEYQLRACTDGRHLPDDLKRVCLDFLDGFRVGLTVAPLVTAAL